MPKIIEDDNGNELTVYTAEELASERSKVEEEYKGKLAEKDEHVKKKLDEFMQGKKSVEQLSAEAEAKQKEVDAKIDGANKLAQDAIAKADAERQARLFAIRDYMFEQYGSTDPEVKKKLLEGWDLANVPMDNEENIKRRVQVAASIAGVNGQVAVNPVYGAPFSVGYAPQFNQKKEGVSDAEHELFKQELGLGNFIPKNKQE